ncbi:MAG: AbiV family abortive infection protein [Candidatus Bathyarchaeia archaeon]|jgi:AbiV family abortive infection protein
MEVPKSKLKKGVELCFDNVNKLIEDAEILFRRRSYGHSVFLAYSAIEETSKAFMYALSRIESSKPDELNRVNQHSAKLDAFMGVQIMEFIGRAIEKGPQKPDRPLDVKDFEEMERDVDSLAGEIWNLRLQGLYVDYRKGRWLSPSDMKRKDAKYWLEYAEGYKKKIEPVCRTIVDVPKKILKQAQDSVIPVLENLSKAFSEHLPENAKLAYENGIITKELYKQIMSKKG